MTAYRPVFLKCNDCGESVFFFPRSFQKNHIVLNRMSGSGSFSEDLTGRAGFMLAFILEGERFTIKWPVLQSKKGNLQAAQRQAATALYHEIKAACVKVKFLGARSAFLAFLMLPDGRTASEVGSPELLEILPGIIRGNNQVLIEDGI